MEILFTLFGHFVMYYVSAAFVAYFCIRYILYICNLLCRIDTAYEREREGGTVKGRREAESVLQNGQQNFANGMRKIGMLK